MPADPEAATTPARELSADLYRVIGVIVVVIGHWLVSAVTYRNGRFGNDYPLAVMPWTQWLTLVFQVVPVFFLVGGFASAASWLRSGESGAHRGSDWVRHRVGSIVGPTTAYVVVALTVVAVLEMVDVGSSPLQFGGWAVAMHLWFIPVYLVVVALTPIAMAADRRWGLLVPTGLAVAVIAVDVAVRITDLAAIGAVNYLLCWGAVYQLGICWQTCRLQGRRAVLVGAAGATVVVVLLSLRWYPISMVGAPGATAQNNFPPNAALLAFCAMQAGVLIAAAPALTRRLGRSRLRRPLAAANRYVMALYLWQMVPVVIAALIAYPAGLLPQPTAGTGSWWLLRVAWLGILTVVTVGLLTLVWRARAVTDPRLPIVGTSLPGLCAAPLLAAGVAASTVALARLGVYGFAPDGRFPTLEALCLAVGVGLLSLGAGVSRRLPTGQSQARSR